MGSSDSKPNPAPVNTNNGLLNGNDFSSTSSVVNHIDLELGRMEILQIIAIGLKVLILLAILLKMLVKNVKKSQVRNQRLEQIHLRNV